MAEEAISYADRSWPRYGARRMTCMEPPRPMVGGAFTLQEEPTALLVSPALAIRNPL